MPSQGLIKLLSDLIAIPIVNPIGQELTGELYSEKNIAEHTLNYMTKLGLDAELEFTDINHPNVIGHLNVGATETVLFDAHLDTVSHENMIIDPFDPIRRDGTR